MLSGVMIKTGAYGVMRYFLWLVPADARPDYPIATWGAVVAVLGTVTLFTGTMQALKQEQSKRLLAFHSIGQIGYILLGIGACMALLGTGDSGTAGLAVIALFGALYHVVNHGLFKGLLFLNAGSMLHATGTQDLNRLGGLMRWMPLTAVTALVASFSISGVPLFNGFVSKWTIYVAAIQGSHGAPYLAVCAVIAIFTSVITLASFVKFFGVSFLSRTSTLVRERASKTGRLEVGWTMQVPQVALAACCVLLGLAPSVAFSLLRAVLDASRQGFGATLADAIPMTTTAWLSADVAHGSAVIAPLILAALLGSMLLLSWLVSRIGGAARRAAEPWLCGYARETDFNRYAAHGFYGEIKRYFGWIGGAPHPRSDRTAGRGEH